MAINFKGQKNTQIEAQLDETLQNLPKDKYFVGKCDKGGLKTLEDAATRNNKTIVSTEKDGQILFAIN